MNAPIAIFAYNRKENLEKMLHSLEACNGFDQSRLFVFIDGPKTEADIPKVNQVRDFVKGLHYPNIEVVAREKNIGLKESIFQGVSDICDRFGSVIVLEDDLVLSTVALDYFNNALEKYKDEPRVWSVCGYQFKVKELEGYDRALVLPFTHTWGWATWKRAWSQYDLHAPVDPSDLRSATFKRFFDVNGVHDFTNQFLLALAGRTSCWFVPWYYKMFLEGGVSIFPPESLIANNGMKSGGTHASGLNPYYLLVKSKEPSQKVYSLPNKVKIDYWAIDHIRTSWDARVQTAISHLGRIKRLIIRKKA